MHLDSAKRAYFARRIKGLLHFDAASVHLEGNANGAGSRNRTCDLMITNQALYQLSYSSVLLAILSDSGFRAPRSGPTPGGCG